jgi:hypothetical protein
MSREESKDFYKVTELTRDFVEFLARDRGEYKVADMYVWQVRATLAIAQQLTMVAKYLGKIVAKAEVEALKNDTH